MKKERRKTKGFTIIELLVVVLIIGILAAIALPQYRKAVAKAELAQILGITKSFSTSLHGYYLANNSFPRPSVNGKNGINLLDIEIKDKNIICKLEGSTEYTYVLCSNRHFAIWTEVFPNTTKIIIIGTNASKKTPLSYAAKEILGTDSKCYNTTGGSSVCKCFGLNNDKGCFSCYGTKYI